MAYTLTGENQFRKLIRQALVLLKVKKEKEETEEEDLNEQDIEDNSNVGC